MDFWHYTLAGLVVIATLFALIRRNRKRSFHFRVDWESEEKFREEDESSS